MMRTPVDEAALSTLFIDAWTHYAWDSRPVARELLSRLYDITKLGPTSANCSPMRLVFVCSESAMERLLPALSRGNRDKVGAPVVAIIAQDRNYLDRVPELFPVGYDARNWFTRTPGSADDHGLRNTMLQAAYLIIAARALGLDCGPMSGFDAEAIDAAFLSELGWQSRLLISLGYGAQTAQPERKPRLAVDEACRFV